MFEGLKDRALVDDLLPILLIIPYLQRCHTKVDLGPPEVNALFILATCQFLNPVKNMSKMVIGIYFILELRKGPTKEFFYSGVCNGVAADCRTKRKASASNLLQNWVDIRNLRGWKKHSAAEVLLGNGPASKSCRIRSMRRPDASAVEILLATLSIRRRMFSSSLSRGL